MPEVCLKRCSGCNGPGVTKRRPGSHLGRLAFIDGHRRPRLYRDSDCSRKSPEKPAFIVEYPSGVAGGGNEPPAKPLQADGERLWKRPGFVRSSDNTGGCSNTVSSFT
jgi:hypothetical protein